jgi:hypothetical protein
MNRIIAVTALILTLNGYNARADNVDVKEWYLVCTRHVVARIAELARAGDQTEAYTLSEAAGDLCGNPVRAFASFSRVKMMEAGEDGSFVRLRVEVWGEGPVTGPAIVVTDRWTPRWNLTRGEGELAVQQKRMLERREEAKVEACRNSYAPASLGCDPDRPHGNETAEQAKDRRARELADWKAKCSAGQPLRKNDGRCP